MFNSLLDIVVVDQNNEIMLFCHLVLFSVYSERKEKYLGESKKKKEKFKRRAKQIEYATSNNDSYIKL